MLEEIDTLEAKLTQLLEHYQALRADHMRLRQQVVALENSNQQLNDRLAEARARVEALYLKLPE